MSAWTKICFNQVCRTSQSVQYRKGWKLRNGNYADLCDRCSAAYERGKFCDIFHVDAAGWRSCESCGKRIHCGCIVSVSEIILLDAGGVYCVACARKNIFMCRGPNQIWQSSSTFSSPPPYRPKDMPANNWNHIAGPSAASGQWRQPFSNWNSSGASVLNQRMHYDVDGSRQISGDSSASVLEKKRFEDLSYGMKSHIFSVMNSLRNANAVKNNVNGSYMSPKDDASQNVLQGLGPSTGEYSANTKKSELAESCHPSYSGMRYEAHPNACIDTLQQSSLKEDPSDSKSAAVPYPFPKTDGVDRYSVTQPKQPDLITPVSKILNDDGLQNGMHCVETHKHIEGIPVDARTPCQEIPHFPGDPSSAITPLFEKVLSASDAGRMGRIVLPKRYAEAHFPKLTQSEGFPLEVQDVNGNEWVLQFRFWPNNNSRIYVLEGVSAPFHSMQLVAGDTVRFGRINPGGKLVMGFRKSGSTAIDDAWSKPATSPTKRRKSILASKSKRLKIDKEEEPIELDLTWEQAQGLIRPPPNLNPNIVVIDGQVFEDYEEEPVLGKPRIDLQESPKKIKRAQKTTGPGPVQLSQEPNDDSLLQSSRGRHPRHQIGCACIICVQSPKGKGHKYKDTCDCSACLAAKRRMITLMNRHSVRETVSTRNKFEEFKHPKDEIPRQKIVAYEDSSDDDDNSDEKKIPTASSPNDQTNFINKGNNVSSAETKTRASLSKDEIVFINKGNNVSSDKTEIPASLSKGEIDLINMGNNLSSDKTEIPASLPKNEIIAFINKVNNVTSDKPKTPASPPKDKTALINKSNISSEEKKNPASPPNDLVNHCNVSSSNVKKNPALPPNDHQIDLTKENIPTLQTASISFSSCMVRLLSGNHKLHTKPTNGNLGLDSIDPTEGSKCVPDPAKVPKPISVSPTTKVPKLTTCVDDTKKQ